MSEFKGTPGPWEHHGPHGYQHSMGGYILGRDGKICDVSGFDVGSDAAKDNAKLIAAAPELLEALQYLTVALNRGSSSDIGFAEKMAVDAIKKALGQ